MTNSSRPNRQSFAQQMLADVKGLDRRSTVSSIASMVATGEEEEGKPVITQEKGLACQVHDAVSGIAAPFESKFEPEDMRQLALVAHNHMKPAMKQFIETYSETLKKFRITGTQTTMRMCKSLWGEDNPDIKYGLTCTSGPLGGDAQIAALMCMEDLGALIFFTDPLSAHPHQADIDSLIRLSNCGNIIVCANPTSAMSMMHTLKSALENGDRGMIPSFFETLESPAVAEYKLQQELALAKAVTGESPLKPLLNAATSMYVPDEDEDEDEDDWIHEQDEAEELLDKVNEMRSEQTVESVRCARSSAVGLYGMKQKKRHTPLHKKAMKKLGKSMKKFGM